MAEFDFKRFSYTCPQAVSGQAIFVDEGAIVHELRPLRGFFCTCRALWKLLWEVVYLVNKPFQIVEKDAVVKLLSTGLED